MRWIGLLILFIGGLALWWGVVFRESDGLWVFFDGIEAIQVFIEDGGDGFGSVELVSRW